MKKWMVSVLLVCFLMGCKADVGTFAKGDKDLSSVFADINEQIDKGTFSMALLQDTPFTKKQVEEAYQLDMTKIEDCMVKQAVIQAQGSEIAFFKVDAANEALVKKGITYRIKMWKQEWGSYMSEADRLVKQAKQGRIGQYYYFVLGSDSEKMVNYIQKMDA